MRFSLYVRSLLLICGVLACVTVIFIFWHASDIRQQLTEELEMRVEQLAKLQAVSVANALWDLNRESVRQILKSLEQDPDFFGARVITDSDKVFARIGKKTTGVTPVITTQADINITEGGAIRTIGVLNLSLSKVRLLERQREEIRNSFILGVIQLVAVILVTALTLKRIIGPLEMITRSLLTLVRGDTDREITNVERTDQIGDMARAVVDFRDSLIEIRNLHAEDAKKTIELAEAHSELETRVEERTRELSESMKESEVANRAKTEFLANMSHELRTPLNAIIGFSGFIKEEIYGPLGHDKYREYVDDISNSGKHLLQLINDILDVSAIESGKLDIDEEYLDAGKVVNATMHMVNSRADEGNIHLTNNVDDGLPMLHADKRRLMQILLNLLSNAIKFTPPDGEVSLTVSLDGEDAHVFTVTDTGVGMDEKELANAMSEFGQVDSGLDRKKEGTGLGLPLARGLVDLQGGTFEIESEKDGGTTVTVRFPTERAAAS